MMLGACQLYDPAHPPVGWTVEPIGRRIDLEYGSGLTDAERAQGPFPVFGSNGKVGSHDTFLVEGPGVLVGRKGSVGEVHFTENNFWPIDTVYYVRRKTGDDTRFIAYLLEFLKLARLNAATGVPGLTRRDALFMFGAFPGREEQARIAKTLKAADDQIRALESQVDKAERVKQALLQSLFVSGLPGLEFQKTESKIGPIPSHWEFQRLGKTFREPPFNGVSPESRPNPPGTPILNVSCVDDGRCTVNAVTYVDVDEPTIRANSAEKGDFFVLRGNGNRDYVGTGGWLRVEPPRDCIFSDKLIRLRFDTSRVAEGFYPYLWQSRAFQIRLQSKAQSSSGLWMMNKRDIAREWVALPPKKEQEEMVEILDAASENLAALRTQVSAARRVKQSLLQNLLTGKLHLKG